MNTLARISRISLCARRSHRGAVLLEVVLALTLFVGAAAVLYMGLTSSGKAVAKVRRQAHGCDLAVSILSKLQLGTLEVTNDGPNDFGDDETFTAWEGWTWQIQTDQPFADSEIPPETLVTITITDPQGKGAYTLETFLPTPNLDDEEELQEDPLE